MSEGTGTLFVPRVLHRDRLWKLLCIWGGRGRAEEVPEARGGSLPAQGNARGCRVLAPR